MHEYRVTKYDPRNRDERGQYLDKEEWIIASQIGDVVHGKIFTASDYLAVEDRYVRAVHRFLNEAGIQYLRSTCVVHIKSCDRRLDAIESLSKTKLDFEPREDFKIYSDRISALVRANLRGYGICCRLELDCRFFVHFGWDFFMYIGTEVRCENAVGETRADGLFVERVPSPYQYRDGAGSTSKITGYHKTRDELVEETERVLEKVSIQQLRKLFGFSNEHPFFGQFEIDPETADRLKQVTDYPFDFNRYTYYLNTDGQ